MEAVEAVGLVVLIESEGNPVERLHAAGTREALRVERLAHGTQDFVRNWREALLTLLESVLNAIRDHHRIQCSQDTEVLCFEVI